MSDRKWWWHDRHAVAAEDADATDVWMIDTEKSIDPERRERVERALDLLIGVELQLLAANDARQAKADTRLAALATAAIAVPPLILSLSNGRSTGVFELVYAVVALVASAVVLVSAWSGWSWRRRNGDEPANGRQPTGSVRGADPPSNSDRRNVASEGLPAERSRTAGEPPDEELQRSQSQPEQARLSTESRAAWKAREQWRNYQRDTHVADADTIVVRQRALAIWRARADNSRRVAQTKDVMTVLAALAFAFALGTSAALVILGGRFGSS